MLSCGIEDDFLVSTNFTGRLLVEKILPDFKKESSKVNFGNPFRQGAKKRGRNPLLETVDLIGLDLWYLKKKGTMLSLCPIFGIIGSSIGVFLYFILEVLVKVSNIEKDIEIKWPR